MRVFACVYVCAYIHACSLFPGNQILISKYLARRGVVVSGGGAMDLDGNRLQLLFVSSCQATKVFTSKYLATRCRCQYMG